MVNLHRLAEELNIDDIAVCHADKFSDLEEILLRDIELGILPPFVETDISKRVYPHITMEDASSFIVILEHYDPPYYMKRQGRYGNISPAACGEDYHIVVKKKLNLLVDTLKQSDPNGKYYVYVDDSPFSEKHIALRSGLGKVLKNGLFYSKKFGSRCFIGIILTNKPKDYFVIEKRHDGDDECFNRCKTCSACVKMCPSNALTENGLNSYKCISYLTQKKDELSLEEEIYMDDHIYGCDICQKVCPLNAGIPKGYETGMEVSLDDLLNMTNKDFKLKYKKTAAGWRGKKQFQKNAKIVLKNMER